MSRILLVDDNERVRLLFRRALEKEGYAIEEAGDGETALRLFREDPPDLVLTDIVMPGMDGVACIQKIRALAPEARIIAMSGGGEEYPKHYLNAAEECGVFATLDKPVRLGELAKSSPLSSHAKSDEALSGASTV